MNRMMVAAAVAALVASEGTGAARVAGPHRGRIVEAGGTRVEFVVDKVRRAHVYVLDAGNAAVDAGAVTVTLRANLKAGVKVISVVATTAGMDGTNEKVKHFASKAALPAPDGYTLILSVKSKGKTANARIELVESTCGGCGLAEYACICGH